MMLTLTHHTHHHISASTADQEGTSYLPIT
jgi:hypothetical protein